MVSNTVAIVCTLIAASNGKGIDKKDEPINKAWQKKENSTTDKTLLTFDLPEWEGEKLKTDKVLIEKQNFCQLSKQPPIRPFPSLNFCFRSNQGACCLSSQDKIIEESYRGVMPPDCSSQWIIWEILHCVGCHKDAPQVIDERTKTVWLCQEFVERIYLATTAEQKVNIKEKTKEMVDLEKAQKHGNNTKESENIAERLKKVTPKFDKCGFLFKKKVTKKDEEGNDVEEETEDDALVYPSKMYKNAFALFDDPDLKPAFMKHFIFRIDIDNKLQRDEINNINGAFDKKQRPRCFSSSSLMTTSAALLSAAAVSIYV